MRREEVERSDRGFRPSRHGRDRGDDGIGDYQGLLAPVDYGERDPDFRS
ncbi:MAG: hypothetical protein ACTSVD_00925 [Candidatus Thorarchaeota archaeon]